MPVSPRAEQLRRLLDPEQVILFDGAMGTMLYARGVFINQCYDELVLRSPDLVREIHAEYVKAGADVLVAGTATFRGGPSAYADNIRSLRG